MPSLSRPLLIVFLICTVALGAFGIGRSLWLDEAWVANSIHAPSLREMFFYPQWLQTSPPFFLLMSRGTTRLAGLSNTSFRLVPLGFALVACAAMFLVSLRLLPLPWAALATALVTFHPAFIEYSHSAKQYSGEAAASALLLLVTVLYLETPSRRAFFVLMATCVLALTFAYPAVFLLPGILLAVYSTNAVRAFWLGACAGIALLLLWVVLIRTNTAPELRVFWAADAGSLFTPGLIGVGIAVLLLTIRAVVLLFAGRTPLTWAQVLCAAPCLLLMIASLAGWYPATQRMRLWALPCFVLLCVLAAEPLFARFLPLPGMRSSAALGAALLFAAINVRSQIHEGRNQPEEEFEGAFHLLKTRVGPSDLLLVHAAVREEFQLYAAMDGWTGPQPVYGNTGWPCCARGKNALPGSSRERAVVQDLDTLIPPDFRGRIWLLYPTRPSHWAYAGLNEGDLWRKHVWEKGCPPGPYIAFRNVAVSPMICRAGATLSSNGGIR